MSTSAGLRRRNGQPGEPARAWTDPTAEGRRLLAEALGTASLLAAIVGSGVAAQQDGAASAQLFQHTMIVGLALTALILTFGPVSGAHFNPAVTVADAWFGGLPWGRAAGYIVAQLSGGAAGVVFTNATFGDAAFQIATTDRSGWGLVAAEAAATAGLIVVIFGLVRSGGGRVVAAAVGAYIAAAIYFTASAAFANPAVTLTRMLSDTYTGIAPASVPGFLLGQLVGTIVGIGFVRILFAPSASEARQVVIPHAASASNTHMKGTLMAEAPTVLFLCVHNAGRSQMAAGWLRHLAGDQISVLSGGSAPADTINPSAVEAMAEKGIDITDQVPKRWTDETVGVADVIVTMGCGDTCPVLPGKRYLDWELEDPAGKGVASVRPIRDDIEQRVRSLMADLDVAPIVQDA